MKMRLFVPRVNIAFIFLLLTGNGANAAELKVLSSIGMQGVLENLGPKFEQATGHKLMMAFDASGGVVKRVRAGESADIVVIPRQSVESLVKDGKAVAETVAVLAQSGIGLAIRKGAPKPDISSPEALKRTLLKAKSITYSNPEHGGASGIHFAKVLNRLGIANEVKPKTVFLPKPGPVAVLVAKGEAEIAVHQVQELLMVPGVEVIGPLPGDLQDTIVFSAAVIAGTNDAEAGKALINFLRTPEAAAVIKTKGMEPIIP
jgi:molybdate transport system substrate-binding protein